LHYPEGHQLSLGAFPGGPQHKLDISRTFFLGAAWFVDKDTKKSNATHKKLQTFNVLLPIILYLVILFTASTKNWCDAVVSLNLTFVVKILTPKVHLSFLK
jgi:antibiotic biosynthesis monooxygenase (ABM) superfamily enzyme